MANIMSKYALFEAFGVEIEFMIVDRDTLHIRPIADKVLGNEQELTFGPLSWNNELALHVIEIKATKPFACLEGVDQLFMEQIHEIQRRLAPYNAMLLPGGMHPWMDPTKETKIWPHQNQEIYSSFDRIFNCNSHGWGNLQSSHLNLPFANDEEFGRLHASIRALLPLIPALAASTPFANGSDTGLCDYRLEVYRTNARKYPIIAGEVIPEPIYLQKEYEEKIFLPIEKVMKPLDTLDVFEPIWVNSRGAIARFDRGSIEIRVIDSQESPLANIAILQGIVEVLKFLTSKKGDELKVLKNLSTKELLEIFSKTISQGEEALIDAQKYLDIFSIKGPIKAKDLWKKLIEQHWQGPDSYRDVCLKLIKRGTLATALRKHEKSETLPELYRLLSDTLEKNAIFS